MTSWILPEIGVEKVVYEATRDGVNSAKLPDLPASVAANDAIELQSKPKQGRLRVTEKELEVLLTEEREQAHQQGFDEGLAKGEKQGYEDGAKAAQITLNSALSVVKSIEEQLPAAVNIHNQREQQLILQLLEKLVRSVTQAELQLGRSNMQKVVAQAINCLADADQVITVRVAPEDRESLTALSAENQWSYIADESLTPGDCLVESRRAILDHSVEHRIDEALSALRSQFELTQSSSDSEVSVKE